MILTVLATLSYETTLSIRWYSAAYLASHLRPRAHPTRPPLSHRARRYPPPQPKIMPGRRKQANGSAADGSSPSKSVDSNGTPPARSLSINSIQPPGPLSIVITDDDREEVKVNNASVSELKNACDDALKRVRLSPQKFLKKCC